MVESEGGEWTCDGEGSGIVRIDRIGIKVEERPVGRMVGMKAVGKEAGRLVRRERYVELIQRGG